jgi:hypothetical protein
MTGPGTEGARIPRTIAKGQRTPSLASKRVVSAFADDISFKALAGGDILFQALIVRVGFVRLEIGNPKPV